MLNAIQSAEDVSANLGTQVQIAAKVCSLWCFLLLLFAYQSKPLSKYLCVLCHSVACRDDLAQTVKKCATVHPGLLEPDVKSHVLKIDSEIVSANRNGY
uniref:Uncharacterized protein n=1 Tax=Parascaris equorum TaxID=6256 RepID=A0A914RB86_PAREQ